MHQIKAIGFDLFNTLITADSEALHEAMSRLTDSLQESGLTLDQETFIKAHREAALGFIKETRRHGRETHNRFWISAALETQGYKLQPDDPRIAKAVNAYFSAFPEHCRLIPGTRKMLETLKGLYHLGLLSNFTHGPAAREIIEGVGLTPFFDVVVISGELGYCKPHPLIFHRLIEQLGVKENQTIYVGDDPGPDITGAQGAGLQPVWMTYVRDNDLPVSPSVSLGRAEIPNGEVPRISTWNELLTLLNR